MTEDMPRPLPQYVYPHRTPHWPLLYYFRRGKGRRARLPDYGAADFGERYDALLTGMEKPKPAPRGTAGTLEWLVARYQETAAYHALAQATCRQRDNIFKGVIAKAGQVKFVSIGRAHIEQGREDRGHTPAQARNFLDAMRGLFRWATEVKHVRRDPTEGVKNPKRKKTEGFKAWEVEDVARYEARWPAGTRQRVWLHVLLYVGTRRGDAVAVGRQHVRNGVLTFTTEKGREKTRIEVNRRIESELAATLATGPCADLAFICGERGQPLTKESFGNLFKMACVAAGITDKSAHGLRKLAATVWAERGATEHELMAMFGWLTPGMAALYTRAARRKMLSLNAQDRLSENASRTQSAST